MPDEHSKFNMALNATVKPDSQWTYKHTKTIDTILNFPTGRVRVTQTADQTSIIECMRKRRIADLAIYMPNRKVDVRVSVNVEEPYPADDPQILQQLRTGSFDTKREKDRRSYFDPSNGIQYDLTEVRQRRSADWGPQTSLELEIEVKNTEDLLADTSFFTSAIRSFSSIL